VAARARIAGALALPGGRLGDLSAPLAVVTASVDLADVPWVACLDGGQPEPAPHPRATTRD
jgi:hypothetical protein